MMGLWLRSGRPGLEGGGHSRGRSRDLSRQAAGPQLYNPKPSGTSSYAGHQQSRCSCHCTSWLWDSSTPSASC